ncbi:MAG TPA: GNAT family N-acetyltransferase [Kofleriaceae bacterium]|nr:GNAT family N-acetyltransferase [Kofleriaceae bacterium]
MPDVRLATGLDRPEILALLREMIPGVNAEARWRWLYEANPGGPALTWIASKNGQLAGCTSFFPFRLWLDGEIVLAALGGDGFVRPELRRNGVGVALHYASRNAMETQRIGCMYGAPGARNVTPLKRSGSREVGHVARWVRPIRASALGVRTPLLRRLTMARPVGAAELDPMERADPRVDAVWAEARRELRLAAVRDSVFYTWRFLDAPAGTQSAFVIVRRDGGRDEPIGACALEPTHGGTTLRIVDLVTVPGAWHVGLRAIVSHAARHSRADRVDIKLFALDGRRRQMWRSGFTERESKPFLCMIPQRGDRRFLDPDRWYYNGADSDLDTLE